MKRIKYLFLRLRAAFCKHRFFYEWGVNGVDRHGIYCVKCSMRIQSIVGRNLKNYNYEMPDEKEMRDAGTGKEWMKPRILK